jgi:pimeloyl-ACP methyl ester carboxylesterase
MPPPRQPSRRSLLQTSAWAGAAALASAACATTAPAAPRSPFVLVHGAWHGGWCWRKLTPLLRAAGHEVYTPTLTGLGDRAHQSNVNVGLQTHVQDLVALLEMEDLRNLTLVGHSYAGFLIGSVAARARTRVRQLVYLDAFVPEAGKRLVDYLLPLPRRQALMQHGETTGFVPPLPLPALGVTDAEDLAWATPRLAPQPYATYNQPALDLPPTDIPLNFIACTQPASGSFVQFAERVRQDSRWRFHDLPTGHNAMVIAPQALARVLLDWAA